MYQLVKRAWVALAFNTRELKIATDGNLARNFDELAGFPKETSGDFLRAARYSRKAGDSA